MTVPVPIPRDGPAAAAEPGLRAEILPGLAAAEHLWRSLEARGGTLATPYQRFAWVSAFAETLPDPAGIRVLAVRDASGHLLLLLPLRLRRFVGIRTAGVIGGAQANFHLPLFAGPGAAALAPEALRRALRRAGRAAGIDVFVLGFQPRHWDGTANPLAEGAPPAPSDAYGMRLGPDPEASLRRAFSADARKKLRAKERRLSESLGPLAYVRAETPEERAACLEAFHAQKAVRLAALGLSNPYADPAIRAFLERAAAGPDPAMEIHALVASRSGRVLATFAGAVDAARFSGMLTAFDPDPEVARSSPGDLLLQHLVRDQTARGRRSLDLGLGEARYKQNTCDEIIAIAQPVLPVTLRGRAYALAAAGFIRVKRRIKRDPRLLGLIGRLRRLRA
ncbi:GNAT family N-acetyltransferase [Methylobacterium radiodurans]|uniref:GNAT family N-acetyltransferase n=1 Tax=Methylobacterium radiodurans TaxID=2202828 RepID=A0A2U8VVU9_9HYPH|nr:GNAT family N-acetyltransferase [Methylobacterium radiodurans]AWN37959.1 GNAT family N-acetyltransferase [Methylobacterium radiodurans]